MSGGDGQPLTLGISAFYHDSAAALLRGQRIVAAAQEERFTRRKFDASFPAEAIRSCLEEAGCGLLDVERIVFYDKPFVKFDRILETYLAFAPRGFASFRKSLPSWLKEKLFLKKLLLDELAALAGDASDARIRKALSERLGFSEHHLSHAASAFFPSPFGDATVLVLDGVGEWATASVYSGIGNELRPVKEIRFPHSLGLLYSAFTYYCGFKVNSGEYKLMGLAPYGEPRYAERIREQLVEIAEDGSFRLNLSCFDYCTGLRMTNRKFHELFEGPPRDPEEPILERHMDIAASIQAVTEEILLRMARAASRELPSRNLCLAGGVALNCVANGKILRDGCFEGMWIQPAAGDAGGALGAALAGYYSQAGRKRSPEAGDSMQGALLGPAYGDERIREELERAGARFRELRSSALIERCSALLAGGKVLGWFQGRMEFGPRALGARSILGDPRPDSMQSTLNLKIKFRESFRPFAPAVPVEEARDWFDLSAESPYMLLVADVAAHRRLAPARTEGSGSPRGIGRLKIRRSEIPAVTHVDGSARVQTVRRETNPFFHELLSRFKADTGCPVLVNTSFNVRGEPIVNTPAEAFRCFMGTDMDALAIGGFLLLKEEQDPGLRKAYHQEMEKD